LPAGLSGEEGFLLLFFAMNPCFRHYRANADSARLRRSSNAIYYYPVPPASARPRG
jgi:hypothetical protein